MTKRVKRMERETLVITRHPHPHPHTSKCNPLSLSFSFLFSLRPSKCILTYSKWMSKIEWVRSIELFFPSLLFSVHSFILFVFFLIQFFLIQSCLLLKTSILSNTVWTRKSVKKKEQEKKRTKQKQSNFSIESEPLYVLKWTDSKVDLRREEKRKKREKNTWYNLPIVRNKEDVRIPCGCEFGVCVCNKRKKPKERKAILYSLCKWYMGDTRSQVISFFLPQNDSYNRPMSIEHDTI